MKETDDRASIQTRAPSIASGQPAANRVAPHIQKASRDTGVSFSYLMAQASKESGFENNSKNRASSAAGLFQFTKNTWLSLIKDHGADHGLGDLASKISRGKRGEILVSDPETRQKILDLRRDPQVASLMAGEYAKDNKSYLEGTLGRPVNSTDLYMAHFLGPGGAAKILKARDENPTQAAAVLLPQAAHKNHTVFYDGQHTPRSVASVYDRINRSIEKPMRQYAKLENAHPAADPLTVSPTLPDGMVTAETAGAGTTPAPTPRPVNGGDQMAATGNRTEQNQVVKTVAPKPSTHSPHGHASTAKGQGGDPHWPFETGQWPPAYMPQNIPAPHEPEDSSRHSVSYTDPANSADHIGGTMPPNNIIRGEIPPRKQATDEEFQQRIQQGALEIPADIDATPLGKLFSSMRKSLFS